MRWFTVSGLMVIVCLMAAVIVTEARPSDSEQVVDNAVVPDTKKMETEKTCLLSKVDWLEIVLNRQPLKRETNVEAAIKATVTSFFDAVEEELVNTVSQIISIGEAKHHVEFVRKSLKNDENFLVEAVNLLNDKPQTHQNQSKREDLENFLKCAFPLQVVTFAEIVFQLLPEAEAKTRIEIKTQHLKAESERFVQSLYPITEVASKKSAEKRQKRQVVNAEQKEVDTEVDEDEVGLVKWIVVKSLVDLVDTGIDAELSMKRPDLLEKKEVALAILKESFKSVIDDLMAHMREATGPRYYTKEVEADARVKEVKKPVVVQRQK